MEGEFPINLGPLRCQARIRIRIVNKNSSEPLFWCIGPDGEQLGLVIRSGYPVRGVEFLTPATFGQQLALMKRPKGELIQPHVHLPVNRDLIGTQEVLIVKTGKLRVDFYLENHSYVASTVLEAGDIAFLNTGGHGFELLEDSIFIEVKQGPFVEGKDKSLFPATHNNKFKTI